MLSHDRHPSIKLYSVDHSPHFDYRVRCRAAAVGTASCECRHGWTGEHCGEVIVGHGGALLGMDLNLSPVHAGLALAGVVGVAGVATLAKRRKAARNPELSAPLASEPSVPLASEV